MKLGIYGGTYNPVHNGHINSAVTAIEQLGLDKLFLIPTATPPHKELPEKTATETERLEMLKLAGECDPRICVSDIEIRRGGKSYTVDTIKSIKKQYPDAELYLMMGADMIRIFDKWYKFEEILSMASLAVFAREKNSEAEICEFSENLRKKYSANVIIVKSNVIEISSSEIRGMLQKRKGQEYLNDKVYEYIIKYKLYSAEPSLEWLRYKSYAMLKESRIPHVKGCEEEAVKLAEKWGADVMKAREAAILHDCTKKLSLKEQLGLCSKYNIETDKVEETSEKLLHSKTGAEIAKNEFGMSRDVCNAILWHTTGRKNMTLLEKIIYMADYIEPTRNFDGVDRLRALAYEDLDEAMILGLQMSLDDMKANGIVPHDRSVEAMEYLKEHVSDKRKRAILK